MIEGRVARGFLGWAGPVALTAAFAGPAHADTSVLAVSRGQHARVLAEGSPAWCGPTLRLRLELDSDSSDRGDAVAQARLLSRLRRPIETECPAARQAIASVSGEPAATFSARAADGWNFAALQRAPVPAPQPPPSPQPAPGPDGTSGTAVEQRTTSIYQAPATMPAPFVLPRDINYPSFVVAMAQRNPSVVSDPETMRYWASYRFSQQFRKVANQEFELQPLLDQARRDLQETAAATPRGRFFVTFSTQFGPYDFPRHSFPITVTGSRLSFSMDPCCQTGEALPRGVQLDLGGLDAITALPMGQADAQSFARSRTQYGNVDRSIVMLLTVLLDDSGIKAQQYGESTATGIVQSADLLAGRNLETVVHRFPAAELAGLRAESARAKAEADRVAQDRQAAQRKEAERQQAEQERQQMLSQRQGLTENLARMPPSARLRAFMTPGPYADGRRLDNLREARADALITRQAWDVVMLVQAAGDGRSAVPTSWPAHLTVSAAASAPKLVGSHWYLVAGKLAVPAGEDIPSAQLQAAQVFACAREACSDAAEPEAIVERKIATLGERSHSP